MLRLRLMIEAFGLVTVDGLLKVEKLGGEDAEFLGG